MNVSRAALETADRRLADMEDVGEELDGTTPPWIVAAREAVRKELREVSTDGGE